jgi:Arc/MetJ-type ribon-helix-helix transcriptional regulator
VDVNSKLYNSFHIIWSVEETSMKLVTVLLPEAYLEGLDELVRASMYPSRSSAIRAAVRDLLKRELWARREE